MKKFLAIILLSTSIFAGGKGFYEFRNFQSLSNKNFVYQQNERYGGECNYLYATKVEIQPEQCRFYLNYKDSGKNNYELLTEAEKVKNTIFEALKKIDDKNIIVEMASFNPDKYLGSIFKSQKEEIELQFRIIVSLEKDFWENSKKIAKVLDVINEVKNDQKLSKKLSQGDVSYAINSVEPYIEELLKKSEEKIQKFKENFTKVNLLTQNDLFINITYREIYVENQTLEKITLVLPYSFSYKLKDYKS